MVQNKKVTFITGGNRGIGLETAKELGARGYVVVLGVRDVAKAEAALTALRAEKIEAEAIHYDANKPETDRSVRDHLERKYGKLDALVNNAGTIQEVVVGQSVLTNGAKVLEDTFAVNLFAVVRLTLALLPLLEKAEAGRIVNVSIVHGSMTLQSAENSQSGRRRRSRTTRPSRH